MKTNNTTFNNFSWEETDSDHEEILKAFDEGRVILDVGGVIGVATANATKYFVAGLAKELGGDKKKAGMKALALAREVIETYYGQKSPHHYLENVVVFTWRGKTLYVKGQWMTMTRNVKKFVVGVHPHRRPV